MKLEFEIPQKNEVVFIIKDKETNSTINLTAKECYELKKELDKIVPKIKGPESINTFGWF